MTAGPPFERYPVSSGTIFAQSQAISSKASALASVGANVQSAAQPSAGSVSGLLAPPLISAPRPVLDQTQQLIQTTTLAAGAVRVFALAIETYDAAIDSLNERWNTAVADDFGVPAAVIPAGADQQESQDIEADRAQAVSAAREELRRELRAEQRTLEEAVDDSADQVASMLQQGPTASNLSTVASAGGFNGLPAEVLVSLPAGIVRSVVLATAEEFAKGMARTSPGLIGPLRFPGSPLFSYTQPNPSPAQARWLAWAKGLKIVGTAVGFGVTGVNQHLKDLKQYPNMDTEERVGRDGGAILSKALPAFGAAALTAAAIASAPVTVPAAAIGAAAIAVGTGVGYAIDKGGPVTEPIINAAGDATDWAWEAGGDAKDWGEDRVDDAGEAVSDTADWIGDKLGG